MSAENNTRAVMTGRL